MSLVVRSETKKSRKKVEKPIGWELFAPRYILEWLSSSRTHLSVDQWILSFYSWTKNGKVSTSRFCFDVGALFHGSDNRFRKFCVMEVIGQTKCLSSFQVLAKIHSKKWIFHEIFEIERERDIVQIHRNRKSLVLWSQIVMESKLGPGLLNVIVRRKPEVPCFSLWVCILKKLFGNAICSPIRNCYLTFVNSNFYNTLHSNEKNRKLPRKEKIEWKLCMK